MLLKRSFLYYEFLIFITMVVVVSLCLNIEPIVRHDPEAES